MVLLKPEADFAEYLDFEWIAVLKVTCILLRTLSRTRFVIFPKPHILSNFGFIPNRRITASVNYIGYFVRVAHSKCLIDVVLKFRTRQLGVSGHYLRYLSKLSSKS